MTYLFDTIAGRTILVLLIGLGSIFLVAQYIYQSASERELMASNASRLAERILVLANTITSVSEAERDYAAHRLSGGPLELHWSEQPLTIRGGQLDSTTTMLRDILLDRAPELKQRGIVIGSSGDLDRGSEVSRHTTLLSIRLIDQSWLNVTLAKVQPTQITAPSIIVSLGIGAIGIIALALLLSRWLTQPLEHLSQRARSLSLLDDGGPGVEEAGTREVRLLAGAINELHRRIRRHVTDRTQMLAAISHDLRTPLTRLRLRTNSVSDADQRAAFERDIHEMEAMIDATLGFLKESTDAEPIEPVDIAAILHTLVDDVHDAGQMADASLPNSVVIKGRHLALKRALSNLINNAVHHGGSAHISLRRTAHDVVIEISDDGPGIPADKLEIVFEPFQRLDHARGRATGGYGLGLTVARSVARSHGGDLTLANREGGGLTATVHLPAANTAGTLTASL